MKWTVVLLVVGLVAAACGGSSSDHCDTAGEARLCLVGQHGGYTVEAEHLKPGSEVQMKIGDGPYGPGTRVAANGGLSGTLGILGAQPGVIAAEGVAPDGKRLHVSVDTR